MISKIYNTIESLNISVNNNILCAVSGGADSVVMLHILDRYGFNCIVAHCNFKLRGVESDNDEEFVKKISEKLDLKFVSEKFDTLNYAEKLGISVQMAARDLRFEWFYQMAKKYDCNYIALAHNFDDQVETVFYNLLRGTGIRGLCGMQTLKSKIFRPVLNVTREEIEKFADDHNIEFRTDSTNKETKYARNKIRHVVFPMLEEINPNFRKNVFQTSTYMTDINEIYKEYIKKSKFECVKYSRDKVFININKLKSLTAYKTVLYEILYAESLPSSFAVEALDLIEAQSGKCCNYKNITVLKDRDYIIINKKQKAENENEYYIDKDVEEIFQPVNLKISRTKNNQNLKIYKNPDYAMLDADKLEFPLKIRKWEKGDRFKPFGMDNFKKLSDFFTDNKIDLFQKSEIWLLTSHEKIVWIIGIRIDNRFRISPNTENVLIVNLKKSFE